MKKTLIALAAVASTTAFAQSTVTLSGTLDTGLQKQFSGAALNLTNSRSGTSNWTISGAEDLGGGLKATFFVSTSFASDDGTVAAQTIGNNNMYVGLEGGFGALRMGRSLDPAFSLAQTANSTKGVTGYTTRAGVLDNNGVYIANQILYISPNFSGFQGQFSYAPSEVAGTSAHTAFGLSYAAGPLTVTLANSKLAGAATRLTQIGAAYDFSVAKVFFTYTDRSNTVSTADNSYAIGVSAPVGPGLLWADYAVREQAGADNKGFQVGYKYFLSKRTTAYVNLGNRKNSATLNGGASSTGYGFGIQHNF